MNYVPHFNFFGIDAKEIPCITGAGVPAASTEGAVGCFYMDTNTGEVYKCTATSGNTYTWVPVTPKELKDAITAIKQLTANTQGDLYIGDSQNLKQVVTWKRVEDDTLEITIPAKISFRYANCNTSGLAWENISSNIADCIVVNGEQATITIDGYGKRLVLNATNKQLYIRNANDTDANDIVLIVNAYGSPCGGALMKYVNNKYLAEVETELNVLKSAGISQSINAEHAGFYFGSSGVDYAVTWERPSGDILNITIPDYFRFRIGGGASLDISNWDTITTDIAENVVINGRKITITIAGWGALLVFNIADKQLHIRSKNDAKNPNDIVLMINGYGTPCGGELMRWIDLGQIMSLKAAVERINEEITPLKTETEAATREKTMQFSALFNNTENVEPFLFFTDPHLTQLPGDAWRSEFNEYMVRLANVYNETPVERVFCGGDWLGEREYPSEACYRLGLIDATMRKNFKNYHLIVGNHDTNYQGCAEGIEQTKDNRYTTKLTNGTIANLWARNKENLYYKIESAKTDFYVLDTNAPNNDTDGIYDTAYMTNQLKWLAQELGKNTRDNIAIMSHIMITASGAIDSVVQNLPEIIEAFNNRNTVSVGDEAFDFSNAVGKIKFCMCGHRHVDGLYSAGGVPVVMTTQLRDGGTPTYDLCLANYDTNKLHLVRVGTGEDRIVTI